MSTQGDGGLMEHGWPRLAVADWPDTRETLHMWTQIVGKVRLARAPMAAGQNLGVLRGRELGQGVVDGGGTHVGERCGLHCCVSAPGSWAAAFR